MGIIVGEVKHPSVGSVRLEISNPDAFISRVKEINRDIKRGKKGNKEPMKLWKIQALGGDRIPAAVQRLIDASSDETPESAEPRQDIVADMVSRTDDERQHSKKPRPRPGGAL
jgi:hypothetical protein